MAGLGVTFLVAASVLSFLLFFLLNYVLKLTYKLYCPKLNRRDTIPRNSCYWK